MTFNIRRRMDMTPRPADRWTWRVPAVRTLLHTERPTVLGVQEALPDQAAVLHDALGEGYGVVGHGRRADGRGEGCPLFWDGTRLELVTWRQIALSDRPEVPGSTSWGNMIPRVMVVATLRDRTTSVEFLVVNTHLDHLSRRSRLRSVEAIRRCVLGQPLPGIVTGDLNAGEEAAAIQALFAGGALRDAWRAAGERLTPAWGTVPNYRPPRAGQRRIDWIGVTPDVDVVRTGINDRRFGGRWASDHLPVQAVVRLPAAIASVMPPVTAP
ncbi:endonuclease/exonuclease/phosphatase family protein [Tersicoccus phoenicis]|nr:endonuclease/exonuclease/phosphatase family protein [Tersicoccus phoenicis]